MNFSLGEIFSNIANLLRWWMVIAPWEQAIRVRGGKKIHRIGPGIAFRIPYLDRFFVQGTRKRYMNVPTQTLTTVDGKTVTVSGGIGYQVEDIGKLYDTLQAPDDVIATEVSAIVAEYVSSHEFADCSLPAICNSVNANIKLDQYGLTGMGFIITDFVAVKTFRLINGEPRNYSDHYLNTTYEREK